MKSKKRLQFYEKYFKNSMFNKLTFLITLLYLVILIGCGIFFCIYFQHMQRDVEINYFVRAADAFNEEITSIVSESKKIAFNLYYDAHNNTQLASFFKQEDSDTPKNKEIYYAYATALLNQNTDYQKVCLYRSSDEMVITASKQAGIYAGDRLEVLSIENSAQYIVGDTPVISSTSSPSDRFRVIIPINEYYLSGKPFGYIAIDIATTNLKTLIEKNTKDIHASFIITQVDGTCVYDPSNFMQNTPDSDQRLLKEAPTFSMADSKYRYTTIQLENQSLCLLKNNENPNNLNVICMFSMDDIYKKTSFIVFAVIIGILLTSFIGIAMIRFITHFFSSRVNALIKQIELTRIEEDTQVIPQDYQTDEIGQIARQFSEIFKERQAYIKRSYTYEIQQKNASFQLLQSQIQPHFLFNTLEAIRMKSIEEGGIDTADLIYCMSTLLRQTFKRSDVSSIISELNYIEMYIQLFRLRYPDRITYCADFPPTLSACGIVGNLIQPVIENCIIHGFDPKISDYTIHLSISENNGDLWIVITDNGTGIPEGALQKLNQNLFNTNCKNQLNNIGLANVNDRIRCIYGENYGLSLESTEGVSTTVKIQIKKMTTEELKIYVQSFNSR